MKLAHIDLARLHPSRANMRCGRKAPDVADLLPSVRARGVLVPILVRPVNGSDDPRNHSDDDPQHAATTESRVVDFEIVAGRRRFEAARIVAGETGAAEPMPCAIIGAGDDVAAIEASIIENIARLDPDEVTRWESFTRLVREGRSIDEIATTFGLTDLMVRRTLALGNLLPRIRDLYRREAIDATTVRHLTLANKARQREWLALVEDDNAHAPTGQALKAWLFGGHAIPTGAALFPLDTYQGAIVTDMFSEGGYFAEPDLFWDAQNKAIADRRAAYLEQGWKEVVILPPNEHFARWDHEHVSKKKGGRVYIDVSARGDVSVHEGYLTRKEAARVGKGSNGTGRATETKPVRPEISGPMQSYVDLHRHAAVRLALLDHPGVALRLMIAHAICGAAHWTVKPEPQTTRNDAVAESVESSMAEALFDARRRPLLALLGFAEDRPTLVARYADGPRLEPLFFRLLDRTDAEVMAILAIVMGETLAAGSAAVEAIGMRLPVDMASFWQADEAFLAQLRDREMLLHLVGDIAGESIATANASETGPVLKGLIRDHLSGDNGRRKVENWVPRWMAFPPAAYTARGGVGSVERHQAVLEAVAAERNDFGHDPRDGEDGTDDASDAEDRGEGTVPPAA